jgi:hypothetical protein
MTPADVWRYILARKSKGGLTDSPVLSRSTIKRSHLVGGSLFRAGEFLVDPMSDVKGRLITICMLVGALAMIGLVLTGTLQMRVSRSPVAQIAIK